eukprot:1038651-Rhodomonas_salina.1
MSGTDAVLQYGVLPLPAYEHPMRCPVRVGRIRGTPSVAPYAHPAQCAVLRWRMLLRTSYGVCSTDREYGTTSFLSDV